MSETGGRQYREAELHAPVERWLRGRGFEVYTEVPLFGSGIDVVGFDGDRIVAVELKTRLTDNVVRQAARSQCYAHESWAVVGVKPLSRNKAWGFLERCGVGLAIAGAVGLDIVRESKSDMKVFQGSIDRMREQLRRLGPGGVGGYPCRKGMGPAQDVYEAVQTFRAEHPDAKWKDVFEAVPNHYASWQSLRSSMPKVEVRRAWAERRTAEAAKGGGE